MTAIEIRKTHEAPGETSLTVTVPVEQVRDAEESATRRYQSRARLPGFRPGKAPAAVVRRRYAQDIREDALREIVTASWRVALEQENLRPLGDPHIHNLKWEDGAPVTFEFHVEVRPEVKLERLGNFRLKRTVAPVTADQVEAQLQALREQKAPWVPVPDGKPALKDLVHVTIARLEGGEAKEAEPYQFVLGEGRAIPDVEARIMALAPGETADATVRFPDDFPEAAKRGTTREVRITLHEVKRQALPALDDEFAREVGDFDSLEALRAAVRGDLERDAGREADARVRGELIDQIAAANQLMAPRPLVERLLNGYAQAYGVGEADWERFANDLRPVAEAQVKRDLILDHVVETQQLAATAAELDAKLAELAARRGEAPAELRASLEKSKRLRDLERGLTEEKVFAYLLSQSTVEPA